MRTGAKAESGNSQFASESIMTDQSFHDNWQQGQNYENYVGRWSRLIAREFLFWLKAVPGLHWLDVGCGTGALTQTILNEFDPLRVQGIDSAEGFIRHARETIDDPRTAFDVGDAQELPYEDQSFDMTVSALALNFVPNVHQALAQMQRVLKPGGTAAAYLWDYAGEMQFMRRFWDAAVELDPHAVDLDEGARFPICQREPLEELWRDTGLHSVEVRPIDIPTVFQDFEDFWSPFTQGQGPAPGYLMSLGSDRQDQLKEAVREKLAFQADGSIQLIARAWAVKGAR